MSWLLVFDCEICFQGTKQECIDHFNDLPNPYYPYRLIKIEKEIELKKS